MIIYKKQPPVETLVRFAFEECPMVGHVQICHPDGNVEGYAYRQLRGIAQPPDNERNNAMNFTVEYLWMLMQVRQSAWLREHPDAEMTFA